jgi:hypothetical protein
VLLVLLLLLKSCLRSHSFWTLLPLLLLLL